MAYRKCAKRKTKSVDTDPLPDKPTLDRIVDRAILAAGEGERIADQMNDAGLDRRFRENSGDRLGEALQAIDDSDQDRLCRQEEFLLIDTVLAAFNVEIKETEFRVLEGYTINQAQFYVGGAECGPG